MNHACSRVATRFPPRLTALNLGPLARSSLLPNPPTARYRSPRVTSLASRAFTTAPILRKDSERSADGSIDKNITVKGSAQHTVNDRPWQRADSGSQPKSTSPDPTGGSDTKGRLLTTPTRLLKLILPLPFHPEQEYIRLGGEEEHKKELGDERVEPLALLVHPQQPLSYLERLIQAEIPPIKAEGRRERLPDVYFRAEADREEARKQNDKSSDSNVASYSGLGHEGPDSSEVNWVRWSGSTEIGDFIRDAARGREFAVVIEGHPTELRVAVPSFKDRTYYMRTRLRRMSKQIENMSSLKQECDQLAHRSAHRLAQGGFGALATWWGIVYYVTFQTEMGWDLVEPVTYLAGLTTVMGGYLWFLYISKDLSYKAAMNLTVSKRQSALYQERGFDATHWEHLVMEANQLRREIKFAANEYDVEWDELKDLGGESIKDVLDAEKSSKEKKKDAEDEKKDDEDDQKSKKDDEN